MSFLANESKSEIMRGAEGGLRDQRIHIFFFFFCFFFWAGGGGGRREGGGQVNVYEQMFEMAFLLLKENNCVKLC